MTITDETASIALLCACRANHPWNGLACYRMPDGSLMCCQCRRPYDPRLPVNRLQCP